MALTTAQQVQRNAADLDGTPLDGDPAPAALTSWRGPGMLDAQHDATSCHGAFNFQRRIVEIGGERAGERRLKFSQAGSTFPFPNRSGETPQQTRSMPSAHHRRERGKPTRRKRHSLSAEAGRQHRVAAQKTSPSGIPRANTTRKSMLPLAKQPDRNRHQVVPSQTPL